MATHIFPRALPAAKTLSAILLAGALLLSPSNVHARWAKSDDAQVVVEEESFDFDVAADGTYTLVAQRRFRITRDEARSRLGTQRLTYNSRSSKLEVLEARTLLPDGRRLAVAPEQIQDKPLASARSGFDQMNQVLVAFPEAEVGAVLELKTRLRVTEIPFEEFFSTSWIPGAAEWTRNAKLRIRSALPLHFTEQDAGDSIKVRLSRDGRTLEAELRRPGWLRVVEEAESWLDPSQYPLLDVSTATDPARMVRSAAPAWERVAGSPIPARWKPILEAARREQTLEGRLDAVTSRLADEVHYWADWRPIRGGHIPRDLATIAATRFGDCKDFAIATIALARALGMEAQPVFIERGVRPFRDSFALPVASAFNHAIARIRDPESNRVLFIDPTNRASFAHGVFEDIADRPALVMLPDGARMERTPAPSPEDSLATIELRTDPTDPESVRTHVVQELSGNLAASWTGEEKERSREVIEYDLARTFASESRLRSWKFRPFTLKGRIVGNLRFDYTTIEEGSELRTNAGPAFSLQQSGAIRRLLAATGKDRVSGLWLGQPHGIDRTYILSPTRLAGDPKGRASLGCDLKSPWAEAGRSIEVPGDSAEVRVRDRIRILRSRVTGKEMGSPAFREFSSGLQRCFDRAALVIEQGEAWELPRKK